MKWTVTADVTLGPELHRIPIFVVEAETLSEAAVALKLKSDDLRQSSAGLSHLKLREIVEGDQRPSKEFRRDAWGSIGAAMTRTFETWLTT